MFEFRDFYRHCFHQCESADRPRKTSAIPDTEIHKLTKTIERERQRIIDSEGPLKRLPFVIDKMLWTDATEYIDLPDYPIKKKRSVMKGLHMKNRFFSTYKKIFRTIKPAIELVNRVENRPYKLIEIAGGEGFLSNTLYQLARKENLKVDIHCSDIDEDYVKTLPGQRDEQGNRLQFTQLDATNMHQLNNHSFDMMLSLHSIHHFSPEQLARIFSEAQRVCREGILAVDGTRSAANQLFIVAPASLASLLTLCSAHLHDAAISARKMYPAQQLLGIAKLACPGATVSAGQLSIGLNYIKVFSEN